MTLTEDQLEQCTDMMDRMSEMALASMIYEMIFRYWMKRELVSFIEEHFQPDDWDWFYEEYVKE